MGQVVLSGKGLAELLQGPTGPVARALLVVGEKVKVATVNSLRPGFPKDFLGPRIVKRVRPGGPGGFAVEVGSDKLKTNPHPIDGNPILVFKWPKGEALGLTPGADGFFRFGHVNHPGSDFSKYLEKKLNESLRAVRGL